MPFSGVEQGQGERFAGERLVREAQAGQCVVFSVDVAAAAREMHRRGDDHVVTLTCPSCSMRLLPPEDDPLASVIECPACETRFELEEGMPRLHGQGGGEDEEAG